MSSEATCPSCGSTDLATHEVDQRSIHRCTACRQVWYSGRTWTGGFLSVADDIADAVCRDGRHDIHYEILINSYFKRTADRSPREQIEAWAKLNYLRAHFLGSIVRFERRADL